MPRKSMRMELGAAIKKLLEKGNLSQSSISELLSMDQAEVSKLMGGKYELFSERRLIGLLDKLGKKVVVIVLDKEEPKPQVNEVDENGIRIVYDMFMHPHLEIDGEVI